MCRLVEWNLSDEGKSRIKLYSKGLVNIFLNLLISFVNCVIVRYKVAYQGPQVYQFLFQIWKFHSTFIWSNQIVIYAKTLHPGPNALLSKSYWCSLRVNNF